MMIKDLDNLGYQRVVFRCDNEPSILALLRPVKLAWRGDVVQVTSAESDSQSNLAADSPNMSHRWCLCRADFEQFGHTDNCPGPNARAGYENAGRSLPAWRRSWRRPLKGTRGLERARERFAQFAEEPGGDPAQETLP